MKKKTSKEMKKTVNNSMKCYEAVCLFNGY